MAVRPTYVSVLSLTKHCPFKEHLSGTLQLQSLVGACCGGGMFWLRMVLLCPSMICFMFGEQL